MFTVDVKQQSNNNNNDSTGETTDCVPRDQFVCVCFFSLLVLRVSLGFDCISSWSMSISKRLSVCLCASVPFGFEGGIGI